MPTRGHKYKLRRLKSTKVARTQSFSQRVVTDWNNLPKEGCGSKDDESVQSQIR